MSYYYRNSEPGLWTVGCDSEDRKWYPDSDHSSREDAAKRVRYLNGGKEDVETPTLRDQFAMAVMPCFISDQGWSTEGVRTAYRIADAMLEERKK